MPRWTNFPNGITSLGMPVFGSGITLNGGGPVVQVGGPTGSTSSITGAITSLGANTGGTIVIWPGSYDENIVLTNASTTLVGLGPPNTVSIEPTTGIGLSLNARHIQLVNISVSTADGAASGLKIMGDTYAIYGGKFETQNGGTAIHLEPQSSSGHTASQGWIDGAEICWCDIGIKGDQSSYGFTTQFSLRNSRFHNCATSSVGEEVAGSFKNLNVTDCLFELMEDGSEPTAWFNLAAGNTGIVTRCSFPTALAGGKNTVPTTVIWSANYMSGGMSTTQPS